MQEDAFRIKMLLIIFFDEIMNIRTTDNKKYLRALNGRTRTIDDGSGEAILMICLVIKEANETLTDEAFKDLRIKFDVSEKVWSKLLQVGMDGRLFKIKSSLPSKYTTIHQIHCLSDEELKEGIKDGIINPNVSQRNLNKWLKDIRS